MWPFEFAAALQGNILSAAAPSSDHEAGGSEQPASERGESGPLPPLPRPAAASKALLCFSGKAHFHVWEFLHSFEEALAQSSLIWLKIFCQFKCASPPSFPLYRFGCEILPKRVFGAPLFWSGRASETATTTALKRKSTSTAEDEFRWHPSFAMPTLGRKKGFLA